ncbi:MAG: YdcF family protein [Terriglobia bacterium]
MRATARPARPASPERGGIVFKLIVLLALLVLFFLLYLVRGPLLRVLGEWWVVSDELEKAQAIVVLGGDSLRGDRLARAAKLYQEGWAPRLVLVGPALRTYLSETELMQREAIALGVPAEKILRVPQPTTSTLQEALLLRPVFAEHRFRRVIVVTSNFHARRVRRIFRAVFRKQGTRVWVDAAADPRFEPRRWWQEREQRALFFLELVRTVYTWWELRWLPPPATLGLGGLLLRVNVHLREVLFVK